LPDKDNEGKSALPVRLWRLVVGAPKQVRDPNIFHKLSLIPILAWIGLGADGLSSSSYGPEEAYRALGSHTYLAVFLGLATALTVFIISAAYSRIIEKFPYGGGGYLVASRMLGDRVGVVSGSALLVDYVLTITVSIAACTDALFSFLPLAWQPFKLVTSCGLVILLIVLNLRGIKESITILTPIFATFVITHIVLIVDGLFTHVGQMGPLVSGLRGNISSDLATLGGMGLLVLFLHAYSLGGGTYTGIEAVSNGLQIMREPRVQTGKRTMFYMAASLAITAGSLFLLYSLFSVIPEQGRTLNAVLAGEIFHDWPLGELIAFITIVSEGALLLVAAQTGFVDGPRVMSNMAVDSWFPHRFAALSQRLTLDNGTILMGFGALALLLYTGGSVSAMVVMYSINVFLTFTLSQAGMTRLSWKERRHDRHWGNHIALHLVGFVVCLTILGVTITTKFGEGGWLTLVITTLVVLVCTLIRNHYRTVSREMNQFDGLIDLPASGPMNTAPPDPRERTAVQLVSGYSGFGIHTFISIIRTFPSTYKNIVFVSVAVIDSGHFKGPDEVRALEESVRDSLKKYVTAARRMGFSATYRMKTGTDVVETAVGLCNEISREFPHSVVFSGQLTFRLEKFYHRMLHNETAFAIQRRLQWDGITSVILPIRIQT
jgi:amino acid transporter